VEVMNMKKISSKKLVELLNTVLNMKLKTNELEGETYDRESFVYFFNLEKYNVTRKKIDRVLTINGFQPSNRKYFGGSQTVAEIPVTYRKFYGWNE
jgi:hypothetical protein